MQELGCQIYKALCHFRREVLTKYGETAGRQKKFSEKRPQTPSVQSNLPLVVHVNRADQIVTIRNGSTLPQDYLLAYSPASDLKAVLIMQAVRNTQLRTALILEGTVAINDQIVAANDVEREKFLKKFPQ